MESLSSLIRRTIRQGAPIFNEGKHQECFELYLETAQLASAQEKIAQSAIGEVLEVAIDEATALVQTKKNAKIYSQAAWVLRDAFDEILAVDKEEERASQAPMTDGSNELSKRVSKLTLEDEDANFWQDEKVKTQNDQEEGQCFADILRILKGYLPESSHKYGFTTFEKSFVAKDAIHLLTSLGLVPSAQVATMKLSMFVDAGMIAPLTSKTYRGGKHLYQYGHVKVMKQRLAELEKQGPYAAGTGEAALIIALQISLEETGEKKDRGLVSSAALVGKSRRFSIKSLDDEDSVSVVSADIAAEALALASLAANLERLVELKDRTWGVRPKVYPDCFVGSEAITALVEADVFENRQEATQHLQALLDTGLIYHVTREHAIADKFLFYKFATTKEIHSMLQAAEDLSSSTENRKESIRIATLEERYRQFTGLNIEAILNSFYGCSSKDGWDTVDLQNWRNNMKRWGFGRREDQDDDMVDYLAPLVLNVDPETWDKTGDEEWESPWGILAQIAIFDQIPRSAFRGKKEAFKWDDLAIRATKVAIEKGYFETAYKSTLNQFVILLPLEHSESWEDQKLGVKNLLQMLSSVAIEDEEHGHSPYEIVKRLEFSKRLSTAFLEHAQVIAKFKRYPHRNRQHGRTTTLEERIWLASDLVPRWAKSQGEETKANKNLISLPVIPLKRLTRR